jgi:hypothetical protein
MKYLSLSILLSLYMPSLAFTKTSTLTILDKGVKRQISLPEQTTINKQQSTVNEGIIVAFKNPSQISISEFETKYGLKLKTKMVIGYYIFDNLTSQSDMEIVAEIIANENNVKTVKPNWRLRNTIR